MARRRRHRLRQSWWWHLRRLAFLGATLATVTAIEAPRASAQADSLQWQDTGQDIYRHNARRDSLAGRALHQALARRDYRALRVPGLLDTVPDGWSATEYQRAIAGRGERIVEEGEARALGMLEDDPYAVSPFQWVIKYALYFNHGLATFLLATPAQQDCFVEGGAFGTCPWTPLVPPTTLPAERPEARLDPATDAAIKTAVLRNLLVDGEPGRSAVTLAAAFGPDGSTVDSRSRPARVGRHDAAWLRQLLESELVTCVESFPESPPCPTRGLITHVQLGATRRGGGDTLIVHVAYTRRDHDQPQASCSMGCWWGAHHDAIVRPHFGTWSVSRIQGVIFN